MFCTYVQNWRPRDVPRTLSAGRHFGTFIRPLLDVSPKTYYYKTSNSLVFQAHVWWNKLENKMYLCERFKIDVLGTSQGRHPMDVFSGHFEDAPRTFLQNFKNKQQITFKYWMNRFESNTTVMCFVLCLNLGTSLARHYAQLGAVRTSLGRLSEIYQILDELNCFYFLMVLWNHTSKKSYSNKFYRMR